ncbi:BRCT domain-containing protein [Sodiomyces alkalinus F11]|uniref:BRCT domain-containing protein n=1 Tax=Sodiomyces alkalinus (strain CBS 110278 / VKM F-3762 / F11) TaxID=1314773 RepID=A0A3N2PP59_SODAK|nr:BRCT domain-containing protein [Sodiomyces alkalinus F11]ROT36292.1 BRCT domain-containing protein [Sodiomyces alkalinus F11]
MTDSKGLFSDCVFAFVPSSSLAPKDISAYTTIVESNGGTVVEPRRDGSIRIEQVTHIVANSIDFEQFTESQAYMIPVVTLNWIASSIKRGKQAQVRPFSPDPRMIFSTVTLTCADLPTIDKETIAGATVALGGMESADVTRQTTHICALSLDHPKCQTAVEKKLKVKIVLPHWFEDCFKLGKRIDEAPYCLPDPEILRVDPAAEVEIPEDKEGRLVGATSPNPDALVRGSVQPSTVFRDKAVMISRDLNITPKSLNIVKMRITGGGGTVVEKVEDCDMFICQYRDGPEYIKAAQLEKEVGNLAWLLHLISHNEWTSPLRRLLHYPVPRDGIPGFDGLRICISNYGGDARIYLENLIKATGATYTKTMKTDNTHLITARSSSEKYEAAKDWGVETTNHLWIEESYAKCEMQPLTVSKYTHFPPRTNLGEIIGQTFFDEAKLRENYYPGGGDDDQEANKSPRAKRKRQILEAAQENAQKGGPADGVVIGCQEHKEFDALQDDAHEHAEATRKKFGVAAPPPKKNNNSSVFATPARRQPARAGKENDTPSEMSMSTGGRSAKTKAMTNLQNLASDIALYEKEKKRTSKDGPWGGKRAADMLDRTRTRGARASSPTPGAEEQDKEEARPSKKRKSSKSSETIRVMLTGFTRWVGQKRREDSERRKLRAMGIIIVGEHHACDYLAAPYIVRTVKFLRTLAKGVTIIKSDFIDEALETGEMPDPQRFVLKDKENEKKFGIQLETAISRARANKGRLLAGIPIYCTSNIRNGPESFRPIAEANGAQFLTYSARSGVTIRPTTAEEDGGAPADPVYLLTSNSEEERKLWPKFTAMAERGHMEARIVSADWLLDVTMRQQVSFDEKYLASVFFEQQST